MPDSLQPSEHRYGRCGFLLLVAGGASSLLWAGPVSSFLSPLTSAGSQLVGNLFPVDGWRIYTISGSMPIFDPSSWRLEIGGLVKRPRSLTYDQLTALPFVSMEHPYDDSLTLEQLRLPDAMLALDLGGQPLSRPHGSPARVILPEMYGYKGVKWLTKMEFVAKQPSGYWEQHGYDQNAWV